MRRILIAIISGGMFVAIVEWLNHVGVAAIQTFALLLPGIVVACVSPDAACGSKGDLHPPGVLAVAVLNIVNVAFYGGLIYLVWTVVRVIRQNSK